MAEHWDYKTLELGPTMGPARGAGLVVTLEDGQPRPLLLLSERLNELAKEGWEIQILIPASQGITQPTLILRKSAIE